MKPTSKWNLGWEFTTLPRTRNLEKKKHLSLILVPSKVCRDFISYIVVFWLESKASPPFIWGFQHPLGWSLTTLHCQKGGKNSPPNHEFLWDFKDNHDGSFESIQTLYQSAEISGPTSVSHCEQTTCIQVVCDWL